MLNLPLLFPNLLDWAFWVPFFFRIILALQLFREVIRLRKGMSPMLVSPTDTAPSPSARTGMVILLSLLGTLLAIGLGTQIVGVVTSCLLFFRSFQLMRKHNEETGAQREALILAAVVALSLVFLGPGPYSIDLPL